MKIALATIPKESLDFEDIWKRWMSVKDGRFREWLLSLRLVSVKGYNNNVPFHLPRFAKHVVTHYASQIYTMANYNKSPWKLVRGYHL
jgi:hypothetical protein